eukprot:gene35311-39942_t
MNAPTPAKRLILIVDDDQLLAAFLSEVLGHAGYDTVLAYSADQALAQVAEREPDMALLDIHMPGMSGLELAKQLNRNTSVPFMFLSGRGDSDAAKQAAAYGAVGFVVKPVDEQHLMPAFEAGLARADEIRQLRRTELNLNAALDEIVLASGFPIREPWERRPLQLKVFGDQLAGEHFFDRLEALRAKGGVRLQSLQVFHLCLLLGFKGKYALDSSDKLACLTARVGDEIAHIKGKSRGFAPRAAALRLPAMASAEKKPRSA